ncbi:unnamed protein product [Brassica rapa subsp. narinosa]
MSFLYEKSDTWRWLVRKTRDSRSFFFTFATVCGVIPGIIGYGVMQATNSTNPELEARLRQSARPETVVCIIGSHKNASFTRKLFICLMLSAQVSLFRISFLPTMISCSVIETCNFVFYFILVGKLAC